MNDKARSALFRMGGAITREMAEHHACRAAEAGATVEELFEAWADWDELNAPQYVHSTSHPDCRCACPHVRAQHDPETGKCLSLACGCLAYAPGGKRWTA